VGLGLWRLCWGGVLEGLWWCEYYLVVGVGFWLGVVGCVGSGGGVVLAG
jgi:hypothetical protein